MKVGHVPLIPYHRPGEPGGGRAGGAAIEHYGAQGTPIRAVMLERLGPNVWHDTPGAGHGGARRTRGDREAVLLSARRTRPQPLARAQIEELRRTFGARW